LDGLPAFSPWEMVTDHLLIFGIFEYNGYRAVKAIAIKLLINNVNTNFFMNLKFYAICGTPVLILSLVLIN